jgi:hypothetical protein
VSRWREMAQQPRWPVTESYKVMAPQPIESSLEALTNLLYMIQRSLDDPSKTTTYLDVVDQGVGRHRGEAVHSLLQVAQMECHEYIRLRQHYEASLRHWGHVLLSSVGAEPIDGISAAGCRDQAKSIGRAKCSQRTNVPSQADLPGQ